MRKINFAIISIALIALLAVTGCSSTNSADDEQIVINEEDMISAGDASALTDGNAEEVIDGLFNVGDLDIASYRIRGEGPDGAYFDWVEATSPMIALADIRRGEWTLYAQGLNEKGEVVVQGQLETFLSEDSPVDNLVFDESYGKGNVRCAIAWNPHQVQHPDIDVYVQRVGGQFVPHDDSEISYGNGTAIWETKGLDSGSYIVRFILKDRSSVVSGAAAALRVIDDKTSIGNVRMTIGDLSQIYGITLDNIPSNVLQGSLVFDGLDEAVFESDTSDLVYDWYIDGNYAGAAVDSEKIDLTGLSKGYHRIDVIARTDTYGSINGDSIHIYTDGEKVSEIAEEEVNKVVEMFLPTAENAQALRAAENAEAGAEAAETPEETVTDEAVSVAEAVTNENAEDKAALDAAAAAIDSIITSVTENVSDEPVTLENEDTVLEMQNFDVAKASEGILSFAV